MGVLMPKKDRGMGIYFSVSATTSICWKKKQPLSPSLFPFLYQIQPFNHKPSSSTSHAQRKKSVSQFNGSAFYICLSASRFISQEADWSWTWLSPLIAPLLRKVLGQSTLNLKQWRWTNIFKWASSANLCRLPDVWHKGRGHRRS